MDWGMVAQGLFAFAWGCIAVWVGRSIERLTSAVDDMKDSVFDLNKHVAVVIEKVSNHEKRIEKLEEKT